MARLNVALILVGYFDRQRKAGAVMVVLGLSYYVQMQAAAGMATP